MCTVVSKPFFSPLFHIKIGCATDHGTKTIPLVGKGRQSQTNTFLAIFPDTTSFFCTLLQPIGLVGGQGKSLHLAARVSMPYTAVRQDESHHIRQLKNKTKKKYRAEKKKTVITSHPPSLRTAPPSYASRPRHRPGRRSPFRGRSTSYP